ncbi:MAG: IPExxxVDY family protein [Flavobacteriales bacterium]|nr:IPExxxVDY family protein [Flavobacteriales bacterium]
MSRSVTGFMTKYRLDVEPTYDFALIGISCHEKDYRLGWALNHIAEFRFERTDNFIPDEQKPEEGFPRYEFNDEELFRSYVLVANQFGTKIMFPDLSGIDFLLIIKGEIDSRDIEQILERIHRIEFVILASELDVMKIKNRETLLLLT